MGARQTIHGLVLTTALVTSATLALAAPPVKPKDTKPDRTARSDSSVDVEMAEQLYAKLDYDKANETAERLVKQHGLTHEQLVRAYRVLAVTYAILDKEEQARDAFLQLLVFDPDYTVDTNLGPKVSTPFVEARAQFRSLPTKPGVEVTPSLRDSGGQLRIVTRDPTHVAKKVNVGWRWASSGDFTMTQVPPGEFAVEVAAPPPGRTRLDFYAQAVDEQGSAVFESGSAQVPRSAFAEARPKAAPEPARKKSASFFTTPIFWAIAGAAALGGGTALFFAVRPEDPPTRAALTPVIRCGTEICK